ncbi:MAG: SCP2 sterol-binding domain-containing protein [Anaerolineae bacterium]
MNVEELAARLKPLVRERKLALADVPDLVRLGVLHANADLDIRARLAEVEELVQLALPGLPPEQWLWIRMERGDFSSGHGAIEPTLMVEFKDEKTLLDLLIGTLNPQMALFAGKLKATPIMRALVLAEFFEAITAHL